MNAMTEIPHDPQGLLDAHIRGMKQALGIIRLYIQGEERLAAEALAGAELDFVAAHCAEMVADLLKADNADPLKVIDGHIRLLEGRAPNV